MNIRKVGNLSMNKLPKIGDLLYAESGYLIARHLQVIAIEKKKILVAASLQYLENMEKDIESLCGCLMELSK